MFGEELMVGKFIRTVDAKGRVVIPKQSRVENGERLALIKEDEPGIYTIHLADKYDVKMKMLNDKLNNAKSLKEAKEIKEIICEFAMSYVASDSVDDANRMHMGDEFKEYKKVEFYGAGDHLIVKPIEKK